MIGIGLAAVVGGIAPALVGAALFGLSAAMVFAAALAAAALRVGFPLRIGAMLEPSCS